MELLLNHIKKTCDIAAGYQVGTLVVEDQKMYIQIDSGEMLPVTGTVEVRNGDTWQRLTADDAKVVTTEGWPAYAGLDARMMMY